jgi:N6-adenosine-specific RNA methylase IME4
MTEYACIAIDPPWIERGGCGRGTGNHYDTVEVRDMPRIILQSPAWRPAPVAVVWMWTTMKSLADALWLLGALGATYKSAGVWEKPSMGMGQYWRAQCEFLLLGTIGRGTLSMCKAHRELNDTRANLTNVIRTRPSFGMVHSRKPREAYDRIERLCPGPRVELFAREAREGWHRWGLEAPDGPGRLAA